MPDHISCLLLKSRASCRAQRMFLVSKLMPGAARTPVSLEVSSFLTAGRGQRSCGQRSPPHRQPHHRQSVPHLASPSGIRGCFLCYNCRLQTVCASRATTHIAADRKQHNSKQAENFADAVVELSKSTPEVCERLNRVAQLAPGLDATSRVLDVGSGPGVLIPYLQKRGIQEVLAVDVSPEMLAAVRASFPSTAATQGNVGQVRTWCGDVQSLPPYQAPFDAAYFNSVFGNVYDQRDTLLRTALLLKPGGYIVLSHPLGRRWLNEELHARNPDIVPHPLPDQAQLQGLISELPLTLVEYVDEPELYMALLQVPPSYMLQREPVQLHGEVTSGFGRGSKQLGFPTANLPPGPLEKELQGLPKGVYFGWAQVLSSNLSEADQQLHKMVMNIGQNPTVNPADAETTVELHILHKFSQDFYGQPVRAIASGFIRPEMKFDGLSALIARIKSDAGIAAKQLDLEEHQRLAQDSFLTTR